MKRVAILSDTHGLLREEVVQELKQADVVLHAGDINTQELVDEMASYAPLYIVRGNNDKEWAEHIPHDVSVNIEDVRIYMVHNKKEIPKDLCDVDIILYGHSHKYDSYEKDGIRYLNPGSCGKRRFGLEVSMVRMIVEGRSYHLEKLVLVPAAEK